MRQLGNYSLFNRAKKFSEINNIKCPAIIQAPMAGGITTPELVAEVSNAGGLGSFATGYLTTDEVFKKIQKIKQLTDKPFSANIFIPNTPKENSDSIRHYIIKLNSFRKELGLSEIPYTEKMHIPEDNFHDIVDVLLQEKIKIVSFTFGCLPPKVTKRLKENGCYLIGTATSLEEAKYLAQSGIDAIVAQGSEAGGHRGGFMSKSASEGIGLLSLLPQIVDGVDNPVIAAGGIMDGRGIVAALSLGASAVQMGTAFLGLKQSGANQTYKECLSQAKLSQTDPTVMTNTYSGKLARGIENRFIHAMQKYAEEIPEYPIPHYLSKELRAEAAKQKKPEFMSMWCGQGVPLIRNDLETAQLIDQLHDEVENVLSLLIG